MPHPSTPRALAFAHLTDLHLPIPGRVGWRALLGKRILGYLSWRRKRRFAHQRAVLDALTADIAVQAPDLTIVSGDAVNISLPAEFIVAARWIAGLGSPERVSFVPGNHDAYVPLGWGEGLGLLAPYMAGEREDGIWRPPGGPEDFPYVRRLGSLAAVHVNTARPTAPFLATGRIGAAQRAQLGRLLRQLRREGMFRLLVLHHPATDGATSRRKGLNDLAPLTRLLVEEGAETVIHGHAHARMMHVAPGPQGPIPVIGAASASCVDHADARGRGGGLGEKRSAEYHLYALSDEGANWRLSLSIRGLDAVSRKVALRRKFEFVIPKPPRGA